MSRSLPSGPRVGLGWLVARRIASPLGLILTAAAAWAPDDARSGWLFGTILAVLLSAVRSAALPDAWLRGEGDWLGTAALPRWRLIATAWLGAVAGGLALTLAACAGVALGSPSPAQPTYELLSVGGPARSIVLGPGESFQLPLERTEMSPKESEEPKGAGEVRVHVTATLGGVTPTTFARIEADTVSARRSVARKTWLTAPITSDTTSVTVTNVGRGALAVLGPDPVQVWRPTRALLQGRIRALGHASIWTSAVVSLALALGVIMGPGVASALALSLWVGGWVASAVTSPWLPGGPEAARALEAIGDGRAPLSPSAAAATAALVLLLGSVAISSLCLRTWRDEVRG